MPSKNAMEIAMEWEGVLYSDEENRRDLAILIDEGAAPLIREVGAMLHESPDCPCDICKNAHKVLGGWEVSK